MAAGLREVYLAIAVCINIVVQKINISATAIPSISVNDTRSLTHATDALIAASGDIDIPECVARDAIDGAEGGGGGGPAIPCITGSAISSESG